MKKAKYILLLLLLVLIGIGIKNYFQKSRNKVQNVNLNTNQTDISTNSLKFHFHAGIDTTLLINGESFYLKDLSKMFNFLVSMTDSNVHINEYGNNYIYWKHFLTKPHPTAETLKKYFNEASNEFDVPLPILHAIGMIENNWTQIGPSIDQGWGIMHLVKNGYCQTLDEAAKLLNLSPDILKEDSKQNIRGAAALLAKFAGSESVNFKAYEEWLPALKRFSGLIDEDLRSLKAAKYLNLIITGSKSVTLWGDTIILKQQTKYY